MKKLSDPHFRDLCYIEHKCHHPLCADFLGKLLSKVLSAMLREESRHFLTVTWIPNHICKIKFTLNIPHQVPSRTENKGT